MKASNRSILCSMLIIPLLTICNTETKVAVRTVEELDKLGEVYTLIVEYSAANSGKLPQTLSDLESSASPSSNFVYTAPDNNGSAPFLYIAHPDFDSKGRRILLASPIPVRGQDGNNYRLVCREDGFRSKLREEKYSTEFARLKP